MSASRRPPTLRRPSPHCDRSLVARLHTGSSARSPTSICATLAASANKSGLAGMPAREKHMDQDQSSQDRNGYDDDAFGQSQPITDKPVPVQAKNSTNGNGAGR